MQYPDKKKMTTNFYMEEEREQPHPLKKPNRNYGFFSKHVNKGEEQNKFKKSS